MSEKPEKKHKKHTKKKKSKKKTSASGDSGSVSSSSSSYVSSSSTSVKKRHSHPVYDDLKVVQENEAQVIQQELETTARVKDLEDKLGAFAKDPNGEYSKLEEGMKIILENPKEYGKWLQSEIISLRAEKSALTNKSGAVISRVDQVKSTVMRHAMYRVDITLLGSRKHRGVRAHVYCAANDTPMYCTEGHRNAIFYELDSKGKKTDNLRVILYATEVDKGVIFMSRLLEPTFMRDIIIEGADKMPEEQMNVSFRHVQPVYSNGYHSADEESADYSIIISSRATGLSEVQASTALHTYQSILDSRVDSALFVDCHLVDKALVEDLSVTDDENNRLALTRDFHFLFDGYQRSKKFPPKFTVFPDPTQKAPMDSFTDEFGQVRTRVTVLIEFFTPECRNSMENSLKEGSEKVRNPNGTIDLVKSFVHVTDPAAFINNLEWKDKSNRDRWENTQKRLGQS